MAVNAASHNPTEPTGSVTGPPPPVEGGLMEKVSQITKDDVSGQSDPGKDMKGNEEGQTVVGESGKEKIREEVG